MRITSLKLVSAASGIAAAGAAAAVIAAPISSAEQAGQCTTTGPAVTCQYSQDFSGSGGQASGATNANDQNGSYGPAGNLPPVGGAG